MKPSDSWDESDCSETAASLSKKPSKGLEEEKTTPQYDRYIQRLTSAVFTFISSIAHFNEHTILKPSEQPCCRLTY